MTVLDKLFEEEEKIERAVVDISRGVLDLSDYVVAKSPLELAEAEIVGKRIRESCDSVNEEIHVARRKLGILLSHSSSVVFKKGKRFLHEMENELSLIHGDIEAIGTVAEHFFTSNNREVAFENLSMIQSNLVKHVTSLLGDESRLKKLV